MGSADTPQPVSQLTGGEPATPQLRVTYQSFGQPEGMEVYQAFLGERVRAAAGPRVAIELRALERALIPGKGFSSAEALELPGLLRSLAAAVAGGAEALAIGNGFDPGLWPARELFDVPVLGLFETVAFFGLRLGARLGVVCSGASGPARIEELVARYGIGSRVARPRALGIAVPTVVAAFDRDPEWALVSERVDSALAALEADGAEVVMIASGALGALLEFRREDGGTRLPVLPNLPILVRELVAAAELARLGVPAVSRQGRFAPAPEAVRRSLQSSM